MKSMATSFSFLSYDVDPSNLARPCFHFLICTHFRQVGRRRKKIIWWFVATVCHHFPDTIAKILLHRTVPDRNDYYYSYCHGAPTTTDQSSETQCLSFLFPCQEEKEGRKFYYAKWWCWDDDMVKQSPNYTFFYEKIPSTRLIFQHFISIYSTLKNYSLPLHHHYYSFVSMQIVPKKKRLM